MQIQTVLLMAEAKRISALFGLPVEDGNFSIFCGKEFELMRKPSRGKNGHFGIVCNNITRAKWRLEQMGFDFDENAAAVKKSVEEISCECASVCEEQGFANTNHCR